MVLVADAPADVNWLLSTAVQSGAALVAIVGGLLVSRLVGLVADRRSLLRQLHQVERGCEVAQAAEEEARRELEGFNFHYFRTWVHDRLFEAHGNLDEAQVDAAIAESGWDVSRSDRDRFLGVIVPRVQRAFEVAENDEAEPSARLSDDVRPDELNDAIERLRRERPRASSTFGGSVLYGGIPDPALSAARIQTRDRRLDELERALTSAEVERRASDMRAEHLRSALAELAQPGGFSRTFWSLGYLSVACVVLPLAVMASAPTALPAVYRGAIVLAFVSGLAVFFAELIRLVRERPTD